jgi:hypothetical protein
MASTRQQFCGDTMNIFGREDQNFQWSRAYSYYSTLATQDEVIWTYGIARAGCFPEFFDCKEMVSWCADKFISDKRIIPLRDRSSVSFVTSDLPPNVEIDGANIDVQMRRFQTIPSKS